jgi:hypothetical protein
MNKSKIVNEMGEYIMIVTKMELGKELVGLFN